MNRVDKWFFLFGGPYSLLPNLPLREHQDDSEMFSISFYRIWVFVMHVIRAFKGVKKRFS